MKPVRGQIGVRNSYAAEEIGTAAFKKADMSAVIDRAREIGVFVVDPDRQEMPVLGELSGKSRLSPARSGHFDSHLSITAGVTI